MLTAKKVTALTLGLIFALTLPFSAIAAPIPVQPLGSDTGFVEFQPFYLNIATTYLSRGSNWIAADMEAKSKMNLRIDIKVYKNGSLSYSTYKTANNSMYCAIDVDYTFVSGTPYRIEATYTAGSEVVPKSMSFTY